MTAEELGGCGEGGRCQGERHDWRKAQRGLELVHDLVDLGVHVARELTALIIHAHATLKSCSHQTHVKGMYAAPQPALPTALPPRTPQPRQPCAKRKRDRLSPCPCRRPRFAPSAPGRRHMPWPPPPPHAPSCLPMPGPGARAAVPQSCSLFFHAF